MINKSHDLITDKTIDKIATEEPPSMINDY